MKQMTIGKKTNLAILGSYLLIAVIGFILYTNVRTFVQTQKWVEHTKQVTSNMEGILLALVNMETGVRGYAVGGVDVFLDPYKAGKETFEKLLNDTKELVSDNPTQVTRLNNLEATKNQWINGDVAETIQARSQVSGDAAKLASFINEFNKAKGKAQMDTMRSQIKEITDTEQALLVVRQKDFESASRSSKAWIAVGLPVAMLLGLVLLTYVIRGAVRSITNISSVLDTGASQVSTAAKQVSSSSQILAEGSSEQAASIEETSASLEEMSTMTKRNAENAQKATDLAKQTRAAADKGASDMQSMTIAMEAIKTSSDDIAKIIKTIDEIAFQTNILALNAAVEAARAGEAGMGFAVVADEVRALAQRSAQAAKETSGKIEGAISKTSQGVEISAKVATALGDITTKVRAVDELIAEVANASREQTQGISQINMAVGQMDKVTQSNAANAEEGAAASEELNAQSETMKQSVIELMKLVGGTQANNGASVVTLPATAAPEPQQSQKKIPAFKPAKSGRQLAPRAQAALAPATSGNSDRKEFAMPGDFNDF